LWADEEADAGLRALGVALVRLRKLLGGYEAIVVNDERASLNSQTIWIDALALEGLVSAVDEGKCSDDSGALMDTVSQLITLYRGEFLSADRDEVWALRPRTRLRARFIRCLTTLGGRLEQAGALEAAIACYKRGLENDDLVEEFYQGLIRCYSLLGQAGEGIAVYERLRRVLAQTFGVPPSSVTMGLVRNLGGAHQP